MFSKKGCGRESVEKRRSDNGLGQLFVSGAEWQIGNPGWCL